MITFDFPRFEPHPLIRGPHAQTIAGAYLPAGRYPYRARPHYVGLPDGDSLVLHDDCPREWAPGRRAVLMIHGLEGCYRSGYMRRIAAKLHRAGIRSFRMDLRGCGAGRGMARMPYHAGCSHDALAAIERVADLCPGSPLTLAGFSMGGNILLKVLGEFSDVVPAIVDSAIAINPAIDLAACNLWLNRYGSSLYDRHFTRLLHRKAREMKKLLKGASSHLLPRRPRSLREFDHWFTAPLCGFESVDDYYARASSAPFIPLIRVPTCILTSRDDPMIPAHAFDILTRTQAVQVHVTDHGGHLGFVARSGIDADRRWMDWRVLDWVLAAERACLQTAKREAKRQPAVLVG